MSLVPSKVAQAFQGIALFTLLVAGAPARAQDLSQAEKEAVGIDRFLNDLGRGATNMYVARLSPLNESPVTGFAVVAQTPVGISVHLRVGNLEGGMYHQFHLHGLADGNASQLATPSLDDDQDGYLERPETEHALGPEILSLNSGDSAVVGAALETYPFSALVGDPNDPESYYGYRVDLDRLYRFNSAQGGSDALLARNLTGRAFDAHGIALPQGNGSGSRYEVNGAGGIIADYPLGQALLEEVSIGWLQAAHYENIETALAEFRMPANVDNVTYTGSDRFTIIGNDSRNVIWGGPESDYLIGRGGDDVLLGRAGAPNTFQGGLGNDLYPVEAGDTVYEEPGEGEDQVQTWLPYYELPENVETLVRTSSLPFTAVGNSGRNTIVGGPASDYIVGRGGDDTLTGGEDADLFGMPGADGSDTITDFSAGTGSSYVDRIDLRGRGIGFADLAIAPATRSGHGGVVIGLPGGDQIFLEEVDAANIDPQDFLF